MLYTCSLFHADDELRSFRSCLRWMCIDQSDARHNGLLVPHPLPRRLCPH
ncbi:hypothetical protein BHE74_00053158 [Ensete ventricosum]|nr:hypothetical protein BHE74_00053158 [Ensete ventricosum]